MPQGRGAALPLTFPPIPAFLRQLVCSDHLGKPEHYHYANPALRLAALAQGSLGSIAGLRPMFDNTSAADNRQNLVAFLLHLPGRRPLEVQPQ